MNRFRSGYLKIESVGCYTKIKKLIIFSFSNKLPKIYRRRGEVIKKSRTRFSLYSDQIGFATIRKVKYDGIPLGHHFNNKFIKSHLLATIE